ncbi:MAG: hypothetical protein QM768_07450 [Agriterribacter sp.]
MKVNGLFIVLVMIFLNVSCTKEISREQDTDPPVTDTTETVLDTIPLSDNGGLLKRIVMQYEGVNDSMVFHFKYDGNNRITEYYGVKEGTATDDGELYSLLQQFTRNENGLVDKMKLETYLYSGQTDVPALHWSTDYKMHYDIATSEYKYALVTGVGESEPINDSITYEYGSDKHLSMVLVYHSEPGDTAHLGNKYEYFYDAKGNISTYKASFVRNYPDRENWYINECVYDDKINPQNFGEEILLSGDIIMLSLPTVNNMTQSSNIINPDDGYTIQYIYNSYNKPTTATCNYATGEVVTFKYYYLK